MENKRHTITVKRARTSLREPTQMETDALDGVGSLPNVSDVEILEVGPDFVTLSYAYGGSDTFSGTDDHLGKFGLRKKWKDED